METRQDGCLIRVAIVLASAAEMGDALVLYLQSCQLGCEVWVNGALFDRWAYRNRIAGQLSFGKVFVNKSKARYSVLVRVNCVQMFSRYTQAAWQIVIEIDPARSREILTSNRDGLTSRAARELDDFIGSIWVSPVSAVRPRYQSFEEDDGAPVYLVRKKKPRMSRTRIMTRNPVNSCRRRVSRKRLVLHRLMCRCAKNQGE